MRPLQITSEVLGAGLLVLGVLMLWVRSKPDRNGVSQAIYWIYQKTTLAVSVETYLLIAGIVLVALGSALVLGIAG